MRIYISSCHSSGKTTLSRYISEKYKLPMISEVARKILSENELQLDTLRVNLDTADFYQSAIFERQIKEEQELEEKDFVSDRSLIDCLAYTAEHTRILPKLLEDKRIKEYIKKLQDKSSKIFFIRPSRLTLKDDGIREKIDWDGLIRIDAHIKFLYDMWSIPYMIIDTVSMQERVKIVEYILNRQ